jgi:hypothetical protein
MIDSAAYRIPSKMRSTFVILLVLDILRVYFVHRLISEDHPLPDEYLMILVLVDINMRLEARTTNVKPFNLPIPSEEYTRDVE